MTGWINAQRSRVIVLHTSNVKKYWYANISCYSRLMNIFTKIPRPAKKLMLDEASLLSCIPVAGQYFNKYRRMAENGFATPIGNFADISYLVEN